MFFLFEVCSFLFWLIIKKLNFLSFFDLSGEFFDEVVLGISVIFIGIYIVKI